MIEKPDVMIAEKTSAIWIAVRKLRDATHAIQVAASESPQNPYTKRAAEVLEQAAYLLTEASTLEDNRQGENPDHDGAAD